MQVIKRDASLEDFNKQKIVIAIISAMEEGNGIKEDIAQKIADEIEEKYSKSDTQEIEINDIELDVFNALISHKQRLSARAYEGYRSIREFQRDIDNTTDGELLTLLSNKNDYWKTENSNKNATLVTTQRDYMAGIVSKDLSERFLLPPDVVQAHKEGVIHFHDIDYFAQSALHNCCLINLQDMLQNGTVINNVKIDKPHRFLTACTIATQAITAVASSEYGGCTITLTALAPFVRDSYDIYYNKYKDRGFSDEQSKEYATQDLKKEVEDGVQTFNYQINSMSTTNGQAPFITIFMYLNETEEYKDELAMIIEEFLNQRIKGIKNRKGVYVTQAFPKLIYALEEDNITEDSKYWYLTELSAKCTAKRMVPDYISEKVMRKLKEGNCFPSMGELLLI
jgi:ribonucleoside-triphosphate reductase